jgi:hypothetical protein
VNVVSLIARQAILDAAEDEPTLWELSSSRRFTIDELRPALATLLREGHVLLADAARPGFPLGLRDALVRIHDPDNWDPSPRRGVFIVVLTESGGAEFRTQAARTVS